MTTARDRILARAGRALGAEDRMSAAQARIMAKAQAAPIPQIAQTSGDKLLERFSACVHQVDATISNLARIEDLPAAIADLLRARNAPLTLRIGEEPAFAALDFSMLDVSKGPGRLDEPATLSCAFAGIAETGTLMLLSGPQNPVTLTFLGDTHFVALRKADMVGGFAQGFAGFFAGVIVALHQCFFNGGHGG